jgi:predicted dehydrogenase
MSALEVAVVGCGHMGSLHASKLAAIPDVRVASVADSDAARATALAGRVGARSFVDWREALDRVDAVVVAVPPERHCEIALAALERGLHVLVEKPIAATVEEATRLVEAAERRSVVFQVAHIERFNPAFQSIAARVDRPLFVDAERLAGFQPRAKDVDVVLDLMIHDIDLALTLVGRDVAHVSACGFGVLTPGIDIANAYIEFDNGCVANLAASRVSQAPVRKYRVFQHNVYLSADLQAGKVRCVSRDGERIAQDDESFEAPDALAAQDRAFVDAVRGERPVAVTGRHGRRALDIALTVGRLARERLQRFHQS